MKPEIINEVRKALHAFIGSAFPVDRSIEACGHSWSHAYLDQVVLRAKEVIAKLGAAALEEKEAEAVASNPEVDSDDLFRTMDNQLCEFALRWELDGDYLRCRKCKRPHIASKADIAFSHASDCKVIGKAETHPWKTFISILQHLYARPQPTAALVEAAKVAREAPVAWQSVENTKFVTTDKNIVAEWRKSGCEVRPLYTSPQQHLLAAELLEAAKLAEKVLNWVDRADDDRGFIREGEWEPIQEAIATLSAVIEKEGV